MQILKFGGTSVGSVERMRTVVRIVSERVRSARVGVVVSALSGVTDQLVDLAVRVSGGSLSGRDNLDGLRERHREMLAAVAHGENLQEGETALGQWEAQLEALLGNQAGASGLNGGLRDSILSIGERLSVAVLTSALRSAGLCAQAVDATRMIRTDEAHGEASVDAETTRRLVRKELGRLRPEVVPVVPGFIGSTPAGVTTTLGRGGSDYTAALLGEAVGAELVEIWTDVDGILSADPSVIPDAVPLPELSYREAANLAHFGAKVLHPKTLQPLEGKAIPLVIRNTFNPEAGGTLISAHAGKSRNGIAAISVLQNVALITVRCTQAGATPLFYARLLGSLGDIQARVLLTTHASIDGAISFVVRHDSSPVLERLQRECAPEIAAGTVKGIEVRTGLCVVAAVGDSIPPSAGTGWKFFQALDAKGITPLSATQGALHGNIAAVVESEDAHAALSALHSTLIRRQERVNVILAGPTGKVGTAFLKTIERQRPWLLDEKHLDVQVVGAINTRHMVWSTDGLEPAGLVNQLRTSDRADGEGFLRRLYASPPDHAVFVDCTASHYIARQYLQLLQSDVAVVTPNKIANTLDLGYYRQLRAAGRARGVRYRYKTTVGAGTPMLQTVEDLRKAGDRIQKMEGVLSGTLSYVFRRVNEGARFSEAVRDAMVRGFTEPHPATDLAGEDVARKLLILVREANYEIEKNDIAVESLVPRELEEVKDPFDYLARIEAWDDHWAARVAGARQRGKRLAYLATFDENGARVGVTEVHAESPFVRLQGAENALSVYSERHATVPLTIQGAGAGPDVTARGILADLIQTGIELHQCAA